MKSSSVLFKMALFGVKIDFFLFAFILILADNLLTIAYFLPEMTADKSPSEKLHIYEESLSGSGSWRTQLPFF